MSRIFIIRNGLDGSNEKASLILFTHPIDKELMKVAVNTIASKCQGKDNAMTEIINYLDGQFNGIVGAYNLTDIDNFYY